MTLAKKLREYRFNKGWGPDELAHRAEISRTALYQIESGKTEQPRASTLLRIASALEIPIDSLLEHDEMAVFSTSAYPPYPAHGLERHQGTVAKSDRGTSHPQPEPDPTDLRTDGTTALHLRGAYLARDAELNRMLGELLDSPLGEGVARIIEGSHRILRNSRATN